MNKLLRVLTVLFLAFGWLFISPTWAHPDDPISIAEQEIIKLNSKVDSLNYQDDFKKLIKTAESNLESAKIARDLKDNAEIAYNQAIQDKSDALAAKNIAQENIDLQTPIVQSALNNKQNAKSFLDIANINLSTAQSSLQSAGSNGVSFQIYPLSRSGNYAYISEGSGLMCQGSIPSFNIWAGSGAICGLSENIIGIFTATLAVPAGIDDVYFAGYTDDGFRLYVDGVLETSQWREQGATWSPYTRHFDTSVDKTLVLEAWWYNGGGPGSMHVGWGHSGIWTGINQEYLSYGPGPTQEQLNNYNQAVSNQQSAQNNYNNKLFIYNNEVQTLQTLESNLTTATQNLTLAESNLTIATSNKEEAIDVYNQAVIDLNIAIDDAWDYYHEQAQRELNAAIAQAAANAAANQPSPEPTVAPTPEPSPEPTVEPTLEPTPEPTLEPSVEPTKDPEPEPTVEPTTEPTIDPTPEPTPGPEPTVEPEPTPTEKPGIKDKELASLVPEKGTGTTEDLSGVIANLTSKDNKLVKLSPEQVTAVSQTLKSLTVEAKAEIASDLGISPSEVAKIADQMKDNPALAEAFVEFGDRAEQAGDTPMPYTLADATTEVQTEAFLADPLGAIFNIDAAELLSNFSELGSDMTDDQREKAQEVIVPVIIASQIAGAVMRRM